MNITLLKSSVYFGSVVIIHNLYVYYASLRTNLSRLSTELIFLSTIGVITSVLNHGLTNEKIKMIDRLVMIIGFFYYVYVFRINSKPSTYISIELILAVISATLFLLSKNKTISSSIDSNVLHAIAHLTISTANILAVRNNL